MDIQDTDWKYSDVIIKLRAVMSGDITALVVLDHSSL